MGNQRSLEERLSDYPELLARFNQIADVVENTVGDLGLILCAEKKQEHIELLELDKSGIYVAQYLNQLPPREILEERLRNAIETAREKHARLKALTDEKITKNKENP